MKFVNRYLGRSTLVEQSSHSALSFVPNIARSPVFFDGEVKHPVEFREAMSALHEVVVGDFRRQRHAGLGGRIVGRRAVVGLDTHVSLRSWARRP